MHKKLAELAVQYARVKQRVMVLEGRTALSSLTARTFDDLRHTLDHLLIGIKLESDPVTEGEAEHHYAQAADHFREYQLDAYEIIAGRALTKTRDRLEAAGSLTQVAKARNYHTDAIEHYNQGRIHRTNNEDKALDHFDRAADLSIQAAREIQEVPRAQKYLIWWGILLGLATASLTIYRIFFWSKDR